MYRAIGITDDKKASLKGERTLLLFIFLSPLFLYFLAVLGLRCCVRAFSSCGQPGPPSDCGVSSYCKALALAHELRSLQHTSSVVGAHGLSCSAACGSFRQEIQPVSPALAGRFLSTVPPGKPRTLLSEST